VTISIYNLAKAPMGWVVYCDGVRIGGVFGSKIAAFDAATLNASVAVQGGYGVQLNVPDVRGSDSTQRVDRRDRTG
jgi:hypothetical protein